MDRLEFKRQSLHALQMEFDAIKRRVVDFAKYGDEKLFEKEALGSLLPNKIVKAATDIEHNDYGVALSRRELSRLRIAILASCESLHRYGTSKKHFTQKGGEKCFL